MKLFTDFRKSLSSKSLPLWSRSHLTWSVSQSVSQSVQSSSVARGSTDDSLSECGTQRGDGGASGGEIMSVIQDKRCPKFVKSRSRDWEKGTHYGWSDGLATLEKSPFERRWMPSKHIRSLGKQMETISPSSCSCSAVLGDVVPLITWIRAHFPWSHQHLHHSKKRNCFISMGINSIHDDFKDGLAFLSQYCRVLVHLVNQLSLIGSARFFS